MKSSLQLVLMSDTHELHREVEVPGGDMLVHAGDFTLFSGKFQPFGEALFGAAHTNLDANLCKVVGDGASGTGNNNGFAMEFGGGLDVPITKSIQFRPVEVDYLYTHFGSNHIAGASASQNNFKYVAGVNFTFGGS